MCAPPKQRPPMQLLDLLCKAPKVELLMMCYNTCIGLPIIWATCTTPLSFKQLKHKLHKKLNFTNLRWASNYTTKNILNFTITQLKTSSFVLDLEGAWQMNERMWKTVDFLWLHTSTAKLLHTQLCGLEGARGKPLKI